MLFELHKKDIIEKDGDVISLLGDCIKYFLATLQPTSLAFSTHHQIVLYLDTKVSDIISLRIGVDPTIQELFAVISRIDCNGIPGTDTFTISSIEELERLPLSSNNSEPLELVAIVVAAVYECVTGESFEIKMASCNDWNVIAKEMHDSFMKSMSDKITGYTNMDGEGNCFPYCCYTTFSNANENEMIVDSKNIGNSIEEIYLHLESIVDRFMLCGDSMCVSTISNHGGKNSENQLSYCVDIICRKIDNGHYGNLYVIGNSTSDVIKCTCAYTDPIVIMDDEKTKAKIIEAFIQRLSIELSTHKDTYTICFYYDNRLELNYDLNY